LTILVFPNRATLAASISQQTEGWCSPAVADVKGNVYVTCTGVDPSVVKRLNELLDLKDKEVSATSLTLQDKITEANEWVARYRELETRLGRFSRTSELAGKAKELLKKGELEQAGALYDQALKDQYEAVKNIAENLYSRAEIYRLQFQPEKALPHYERAYRYDPEQPEYAFALAWALQKQNSFARAELVYRELLAKLYDLARANPAAYEPDVARTLNNLGNLFRDIQQLAEAEKAFKESLEIRRRLARTNPAAYEPDVARTLNNLGILFSNTQQLAEAEKAFKESLEIRRRLARTNPAAYEPDVARTLNNLGNLFRDTQQLAEAEKAFKESLEIGRRLARTNPAAYEPDVARTLNNLGNLFRNTQQLAEAEKAFKESLEIYRRLARANPSAYDPYVALVGRNLEGLLRSSVSTTK
jgi:tetratricopeptide (TPR) repeat protein